MDKFEAMRAFVEIVDRGSLTAAGGHLEKSLPSMVRTLAALETSLGVRLLQRTTRRMSLTEEGRGFLERSRRILSDLDEAERAVHHGAIEARGEIRVTAPVLFGQRHVAPQLARFLEQYPQVRVELLLFDAVVDLLEQSIDVAIRIGPLADSSMIAVGVGRMRRVVCASPQLLERVGEPRRPEELAEHPCVGFRGLASGATWRFHEAGRELLVRVRGPLACNHALVSAEACAAGLGFGVFLLYQVEPMLETGRLRVVLRDFEPPPLPVSLVYPDAHFLTARVRAFIDWMKDRLMAVDRAPFRDSNTRPDRSPE